jgi:hypothetical protein
MNRIDFYLIRVVNLITGKMLETVASEAMLDSLQHNEDLQVISYQYDHTFNCSTGQKFQKSFF